MIAVRLFGIPRIEVDGAPFQFRPAAKVVELLGYLAVHAASPVPRETVRAVLWPDCDDEAAGANLRRHLHLLAKALPPVPDGVQYLLNSRFATQWNAAAAWCDVVAFATDETAYGGDFMETFYEEWVLAEREHFRALQLERLRASIRRKRGERDLTGALADIARSLAIDPWREDAVRAEMVVRADIGDRSGALSSYRTFAERLRAELDVEPMPETRAVYERLLLDVEPADRPIAEKPATAGLSEVRSLPFRGRERELNQLLAAWDRAARGQGTLAMIGGEAGVGKTRLVNELMLRAEAQGGRVFVGTTSPGEVQVYESLVEALRSALPLILGLLRDPHVLGNLSALLPELSVRSDVTIPPEASAGTNLTRLIDSVIATVGVLARGRPLLLVLEDLHWAGAATMNLLEHLVRRLATSSVLVVGTYREEEVAAGHSLRAVRRRLEAEGSSLHVAVERFAFEAIQAIVKEVLEERASDEAFLRDLHARSEGLPLFLEELIRDPQRQPETVRLGIPARLERLDEEARTLVEICAVAGVGFDVALISDASGWHEADILRALQGLTSARFVREPTRRTRNDFVFAHHLIQGEIYAAIDPAVRKRRHAAIARALQAASASDTSRAAEVAHHYERGGEPAAAAESYATAVRHAAKLFAGEEVLEYAVRALALTSDPSLVVEMRLARARVAMHLALFEVESEEFAALDALPKDARQSALVWTLRATSLKNRGQYGAAKDVLDKAVAAARSTGDESVIVEALFSSAQVRIWSGDYAEAERAIQETESLAGENRRARLMAMRLRSLLLLNRRQVDASRELSVRVVELARELGDLEAEAEAECRISQALVEVGEFDAADRHFERSMTLYPYARLGSGITACGWRLAMINLALIRGRYAYAEAELEDLLERCREIGADQYILAVTQGRALTAIYRGDSARALDIMEEVAEMEHDPLNVGLRGLVVGAAAAELGLDRRSAEAFDDMVEVFGGLPPTQFFSMGLGLAILAALAAGDVARATKLGRQLEAFPDDAMSGDEFPHLAAWGLAALYGRLGEAEKRDALLDVAAARYRTHQTKLAGDEGRRAYDAVPWNARFLATLPPDAARTVAP